MSWLFPSEKERERERDKKKSALSKEIEHKHPKCNYASMPPKTLLKYSSTQVYVGQVRSNGIIVKGPELQNCHP